MCVCVCVCVRVYSRTIYTSVKCSLQLPKMMNYDANLVQRSILCFFYALMCENFCTDLFV